MEEPAGDAAGIARALCHEVCNLLAGSQLHAGLVATAERCEVAGMAARIADASARAGALVALLRFLLEPAEPGGEACPEDVLAGVANALDEHCVARVRIEPAAARELPCVACPPELLHFLLVAAIHGALEEGGREGCVRVSAGADGEAVRVRVEGSGKELARDPALRGRTLDRALAGALLRPGGGEAELRLRAGKRGVGLEIRLRRA